MNWKPMKKHKGFTNEKGDMLFLDYRERLVLLPNTGGRFVLFQKLGEDGSNKEVEKAFDLMLKVVMVTTKLVSLPCFRDLKNMLKRKKDDEHRTIKRHL